MAANEASASGPSVTSTIVNGAPSEGATSKLASSAPALPGPGAAATRHEPVDLADTLDGSGAPHAPPESSPADTSGRTTVLPRRQPARDAAPAPEQRPRFAQLRVLGEGAMGQVELARDNDIRRTVAVKRVHRGANTDEALLRFADEVRIVGQLEHPGIVPIYDVGRDDRGELYLVMKHLQGETMEAVIEKLRAGDADHLARFTPGYRVHLFRGLLDAVRYAHARRILHRDLKPANVIIGPYGEVTVIDWGIAKPFSSGATPAASAPVERALVDSHGQRLLETSLGALAGTPLYMSPEQAAGRNGELDERSDVYALSGILYEWLVLEHPLHGKRTVTEVIAALIAEDRDPDDLFARAAARGVPLEYVHVVVRGLARDPARRYRTVDELEQALERILEGRVAVQCHVTLAKRAAHGLLHWIDRHATLFSVIFFGGAAALALGLVAAVWLGLRALW